MTNSGQSQMTYADYLHLNQLLALQKPKSSSEHELLFIVVHQCAELFFKCALDESKKILDQFEKNVKDLANRISRLTAILETASGIVSYQQKLTPLEFAEFRPELGTA